MPALIHHFYAMAKAIRLPPNPQDRGHRDEKALTGA
jgi:hypothetical protein